MGKVKDLSLGDAVGDYPAVGAEEQDGQVLQSGSKPQGRTRIGQLKHQPDLGDLLHERARSGNDLAEVI